MNGMWKRNRAFERDVVVLELLPPEKWLVRGADRLDTFTEIFMYTHAPVHVQGSLAGSTMNFHVHYTMYVGVTSVLCSYMYMYIIYKCCMQLNLSYIAEINVTTGFLFLTCCCQ